MEASAVISDTATFGRVNLSRDAVRPRTRAAPFITDHARDAQIHPANATAACQPTGGRALSPPHRAARVREPHRITFNFDLLLIGPASSKDCKPPVLTASPLYHGFVRRLSALIVLAILVSMAGVRVPAPTAAASHGDQATTGLTALGRHAAVKLLRDAGLEMARTEIPAHALRAVVIDLDKDGDSDLVANVGSLELGVWLNDGTGRLTRAPKNAPAAPSWAPVPPTPSFETDGPEQAATSPDDAPTMRFEPIRAGPVPQPVAILTRDAAPAVAFEAADPSSPRAPPLA